MSTPIPQEMRDRDQWLTWINANGTKMPCSATSGDVCDATNPTNWSTYEQACIAAATRKHAGPAFSFADDDGLSGVDLDDCRNPETGDIEPWAQAIIDNINSFTEVSPSGTGVKIFCGGKLPKNIKTKQIEIYSRKRFFTVTANHLEGTPTEIRDAQAELTVLADRLRPKQAAQPNRTAIQPSADGDHCRRYAVAALESEHQAMMAAADGERHNTRIRAAYALAGYIPHITEDEITAALAVNFGANEDVARKTIVDGIAAGKGDPRSIPEPKRPTFDGDGYACCPTHGDHLIASRNGNGYRCSHAMCFWWQGEGYTPPADLSATDVADIDNLDPAELRRRYLIVVAERDRWKLRAEQLQLQLGDVQQRNRFVTQAAGAEGIGAPSMRLTFVELKKELDTADGDGRKFGDQVKVRPAYMAKCTGQNRSTIGRHLDKMQKAGLIEKEVRSTYDPNTDSWCSEMFIKPLVDLSDPAQVVIPTIHGGKRERCPKCNSDNVAWMRVKVCRDCEHMIGDVSYQPVNPELQDANQELDAATFFEQMATEGDEGPICSVQPNKRTVDLPTDLQDANHSEPVPAYCPGEVWNAMWHGPETNELVTVIGLWDASQSPDGRAYYKVQESRTGMPVDEVELMDLLKPAVALLGVPAIIEETLDLTTVIRAADQYSPPDELGRNAFKTALAWLNRREPGKAEALIERIQDPQAQAIVAHLVARPTSQGVAA